MKKHFFVYLMDLIERLHLTDLVPTSELVSLCNEMMDSHNVKLKGVVILSVKKTEY